MLNWVNKLFGREQKVTVRGDQYDRLLKRAQTRPPVPAAPRGIHGYQPTAQTPPQRLPASPSPRRDSTDESTPLIWPVLVSDSQVRGMDSMSASLPPADPPSFSSGGGGDYSGGGASGSWDSGSSDSSSRSSSDSSSSSSSD